MGFTFQFDDTRTKVARLNARQHGNYRTLYVEPAKSVLQDEWDAFDAYGDYVYTYTTRELTSMKGRSLVTVLNRFSNHPWSLTQDPPRKPRKRTRRGGRKPRTHA